MDLLFTIFKFILSLWWAWLAPLLGYILHAIYMEYIWTDWISKIDWILLKIQVPKEVEHGPKNMESVLSQLYGGITGGGSSEDKVVRGRIPEWFSLEIESNGGMVSFYIRIARSFRQLVEAAFYAQYPDVSITEAEDYTKDVPDDLPDDNYDIFGTDITLTKEDGYPIRTYVDFKDELADVRSTAGVGGVMKTSGSWIDPMSAVVEAMANVRPTDRVWMQLLLRPAGGSWKDEALKLRDSLIEREKAQNPSAFKQFVEDASAVSKNVASEVASVYSMGQGAEATFPTPAEPKESRIQRQDVTPGEMETILAIERSINKIGFMTEFRACSIDKKDPPARPGFIGVWGAIHQFNTQNLNSFDFRYDSGTKMPRYTFLANFRMIIRKHRLLARFKSREFALLDKDNYSLGVLNTEELATIFHFPATFVQTPRVDRAEVRKAAPPIDLPIVE